MRKSSTVRWLLTLASAVLLSDQCLGSSGVFSSSFVKTVSCRLQEKLADRTVIQKDMMYRSRTGCISTCREGCFGASVDENLSCFHYLDFSSALSLCNQDQSLFTLYIKNPCLNNGIWNMTLDTCKCVNSWVGTRCERMPVDCYELVSYGYPYGIHTVTMQLGSNPSFKTKWGCRATFETTFIMLNIGRHDNNRTWNEYLNGFFEHNYNFWIGLRNIQALNDRGLKTVALDTGIFNGGYGLFSYRYTDFQLHGPPSYSFTFYDSYQPVNAPHHNYGDCLQPVQNTPFSTWDKDNDNIQENCAASQGAGWWFGDCNTGCNPFAHGSLWSMDGFDLPSASYAETMMYFTTG